MQLGRSGRKSNNPMTIYLDTNVFYHAYCPVEDPATADWILEQISPEFPGITSELTIAEIFRAFKKQVNLGVIETDKAQDALDFFLADIEEMAQSRTLHLIPVKMGTIVAARQLIFDHNLYVADALHATTALNAHTKGFVTFDADFKGAFENLLILIPTKPTFKIDFLKLKK